MSSKNREQRPFFTIITPSFNQGKYIRRTITSVLSQDVEGIEYLIFDGGSRDETVSILQSFGNSIQWICESDRGQADAVNKGLAVAQGQVIGWLNSDDIYYAGALKSVKELFEKHPGVDILYGMADHIDADDNVIEAYYNEEWDYERLKEVCFISQPAVFFRRSIVDKFGFLDETLRYCMDYEYWLKIGREKPFYYFKQRLAGSRLHPETKTLGSAVAAHEEILRMFKKKVGKIPSRWIYNHAHVVARELGLSRETPGENLRFVRKAVSVCIYDSLRLRYYIPLSELKTLLGWYVNTRRSVRQKIL
jgi:glycosyltransferase involved in cell wall biosynthesis